METAVSFPISDALLTELVDKVKDFALMHGICMRRKDQNDGNFDRDALYFAPFVLFPSPFPKKEFNRALTIQPLLNELMHRVAHDNDFLTETLRNTIKVDQFTAKLFEIYQKVSW